MKIQYFGLLPTVLVYIFLSYKVYVTRKDKGFERNENGNLDFSNAGLFRFCLFAITFLVCVGGVIYAFGA